MLTWSGGAGHGLPFCDLSKAMIEFIIVSRIDDRLVRGGNSLQLHNCWLSFVPRGFDGKHCFVLPGDGQRQVILQNGRYYIKKGM